VWLAVVSQPFNSSAQVPCLRDLDTENGEFWVSNPWSFSASGENLSAYERNGVFLNDRRGGFHNISHSSGADNPGDGRSAVSWDVTGDGMPELFVRQAGGGALVIYRNRFPRAHFLQLSLKGVRSNSLGVGARIECEVGGMVIRRTLNPVVNFLSQSPALVHLGLGEADVADRLTIRWPSGEVQSFESVGADRHLRITEGSSELQTLSRRNAITK
jgi:hypothetical protein